MQDAVRDRALGALTGLAVGDALGMPTQGLSRERIRDTFGRIDGFRIPPRDHPIARGLPAGSVTDDTEQALLLAEVLVEGDGHADPHALAERLAAWEERMRARGSLDLLGPSTRSAVAAIRRGVPIERAGRGGTTNGAAMRVAPLGIAVAPDDLDALVDRVAATCLPTHGTSVAIAGAAAVAAAVSAGVGGAGTADCIRIAVEAAALGVRHGAWVAGADVGARIAWITERVRHRRESDALDDVADLVGTSLATQESVPAAFGLVALFPDDPWAACRAAAALGGDTDTIGAMAGAVLGAVHGVGGFPADAVRTLHEVNALQLERIADALVALRRVD